MAILEPRLITNSRPGSLPWLWVHIRSLIPEDDAQPIRFFSLIDFFLHIFGLRFAIDCPSHVRPRVLSRNAICPDLVLTDPDSIAIWSRNKAVKATSIAIWGAGVAFHINGKLFPLNPVGDPVIPY